MAVSVSGPSTDRRVRLLARLWDLLGNAALLFCLYLAYAVVRRITADDWGTALSNGRALFEFQRGLGLPSEAELQRAVFLDNWLLVRAANVFYMWGHFPLTGGFMFWVWLRHRNYFSVVRNSLIVLTMAGLVLHIVFPLAPPRFYPSLGFTDTARIFGPNPYELGAAKAANQIAAMPSLHVGWAVLVAISLIALGRSRWRYLALAHPILTTSVVVLTANHYWADAFIALILVLTSWIFTVRLARLGLFSFGRHPEAGGCSLVLDPLVLDRLTLDPLAPDPTVIATPGCADSILTTPLRVDPGASSVSRHPSEVGSEGRS